MRPEIVPEIVSGACIAQKTFLTTRRIRMSCLEQAVQDLAVRIATPAGAFMIERGSRQRAVEAGTSVPWQKSYERLRPAPVSCVLNLTTAVSAAKSTVQPVG